MTETRRSQSRRARAIDRLIARVRRDIRDSKQQAAAIELIASWR